MSKFDWASVTFYISAISCGGATTLGVEREPADTTPSFVADGGLSEGNTAVDGAVAIDREGFIGLPTVQHYCRNIIQCDGAGTSVDQCVHVVCKYLWYNRERYGEDVTRCQENCDPTVVKACVSAAAMPDTSAIAVHAAACKARIAECPELAKDGWCSFTKDMPDVLLERVTSCLAPSVACRDIAACRVENLRDFTPPAWCPEGGPIVPGPPPVR